MSTEEAKTLSVKRGETFSKQKSEHIELGERAPQKTPTHKIYSQQSESAQRQ
jgi:hypothetical protein